MIRNCTPEDLTACAELAFRKNSVPETSSAYCCQTAGSIREDFQGVLDAGGPVLADFDAAGKPVSVASFYYDSDRRLADCCGPFAEGDFRSASLALLAAARERLPEGTRFSFYFDKRNIKLRDWMRELDAVDNGNEYFMALPRAEFVDAPPDPRVGELPEALYSAFQALHDGIFPDLYAPGKAVIADLRAGKRRAFAIREGERLLGYCVIQERAPIGVLEILAVAPEARGRGLGRALLHAGMRALFGVSGCDSVELVVDDSNGNARKLYQAYGFHIRVENCSCTVG